MPYVKRDVDLYYTEQGSGHECVHFCHGAGGNSTSWWRQIGEFSSRYRCIAHDHRGFGRSRCAPEQFAVTAFVDDAVAVLDAARIERTHLVCQSMGGWTGMGLALRHPERVASLVLSDTIGGLNLRSGVESIRTMGERAARAGAVTPALAADYPRQDPAGAFLYLELAAFNGSLESLDLFRQMFAAEALLALHRAAELTMPVMLVAGTKDLIWPPPVLRELAGHFADARFEEVDAGHSPYFENPTAFNRLLGDFLARSSQR